MLRGCCSIYLDGWGDWNSIIVVVYLDEYRDVTDGVTSSAQKIYFRCRPMEKIIGRSILDILFDFLQLEVQCFICMGDRIVDKGTHG